jgi:hypothetical protein
LAVSANHVWIRNPATCVSDRRVASQMDLLKVGNKRLGMCGSGLGLRCVKGFLDAKDTGSRFRLISLIGGLESGLVG